MSLLFTELVSFSKVFIISKLSFVEPHDRAFCTLMDHSFNSWRRQWHPTPILMPGQSHGRRSLVGYSPWGLEESNRTEQLHFHFSLSWIGEGNGNPLQCSCLENLRDGGTWWAVICGVAQSRTRLSPLSSSSNLTSVRWFPHCSFDLHFSTNKWCWASFHVFGRLYVSFEDVSI